jgi:hypothetical protein
VDVFCLRKEVRTVSQVTKITKPEDAVKPHERPDPAWVRGRCPECGDELVSHLYYKRNEGYVIQWECWASRYEPPTCDYKKAL